jgi:hypothetical protein
VNRSMKFFSGLVHDQRCRFGEKISVWDLKAVR